MKKQKLFIIMKIIHLKRKKENEIKLKLENIQNKK